MPVPCPWKRAQAHSIYSGPNFRKQTEQTHRRWVRIPPEELRGATITLSNFGVFGAGRFAELMVIPPQVAIAGAGRVRAEAVAAEGQVAVHRVLPLSLTFDHRVVTGGEAARFLATLKADLERPA